jgi:hypothetical protein
MKNTNHGHDGEPNSDGVAKSPPYGVTVFFRTSTYLMYAFAPEKPHEIFA